MIWIIHTTEQCKKLSYHYVAYITITFFLAKIKILSDDKMQALYSNPQLDLSRGLFPYALPSKILQNLATFQCMLHVTKI